MHQYIAPLGFDTRRVTRPVIREGVDSGDQIVLLQPSVNLESEDGDYPSDRAEEATRDLIDFFDQIDDGIRIISVPISCNPFAAALREVSALVTDPARAARVGRPQNDAEENAPPLGTKAVETVLCPGGGPRELLFAVAIAAVAHPSHISKVVMNGDLDGDTATLDLPRVNPHVSGRVAETFQALTDTMSLSETRITEPADNDQTELTVTELSEITGKSKSTIGRHLDELETEGVVESHRQGKERVVRLTLSAELYVRDNRQSRGLQ